MNAFQALLEKGAVRQITNFGMARNEGDYMLVAHKHKINFYKTTTIRVSIPFLDRIDPFNFLSFYDLIAINVDTFVAFEDYYLCFPIKNIDDIPDYNEVTKNGDDNDGEPFNCNGCGGVSDVFRKVRVVIRVQDETGSASFVLVDRHVKDFIHRNNHWLMEKKSKISKFNLENIYHAYTVHKMTDDDLVVGAVFKHSRAYEENNIQSDGTRINTSIKVTNRQVR
ncbi:unnamed protein product [Lactuca saligna]|uniref:DUF223 domain-containing protein n=1 Tax=Lactuca saligna TaxID=75948 RepID=A0AA36E455_LACSI|nr:unnamed protein product [Lactuca saligna]